ncbi:phosphoribosylaminoimidazolesuccinocarboxamide synthase [Candidatus Saccharibacteria bacterium RIFCSPHIGHO2_12_FULL_41_12]|nr:MAG: phosphoribosylaminoimidazolesuccinocarboxamide synthase [Candidatus Saccharibacteria bacterium RIFCSPHIGHO2_12_FULL_41_12]
MNIATTDFSFKGQTNLYHGKVRDVYYIGNKIVCVATDRISAFDYKFPELIPHKGQVLNQIAAHFLEETKDVAPNWLISAPDPNVSIGYKCKPIMIEVIVRGSLLGSAWRAYEHGIKTVSGVVLPDGLSEYHVFDVPIITPTTKSETDDPITYQEIIDQKLVDKEHLYRIYNYAQKLFARGREMANKRGLILADTKYEFGFLNNQVCLIDEIHTPDSSRYFYKDSYDAYLSGSSDQKPVQLSKEFLREWLLDKGFSNQAGEFAPMIDDEVIDMISDRYVELYEKLIGEKFIPNNDDSPLERIGANINSALKAI